MPEFLNKLIADQMRKLNNESQFVRKQATQALKVLLSEPEYKHLIKTEKKSCQTQVSIPKIKKKKKKKKKKNSSKSINKNKRHQTYTIIEEGQDDLLDHPLTLRGGHWESNRRKHWAVLLLFGGRVVNSRDYQ